MVGDGFWESFRLHSGRLAFMEQHLARLKANAKALDYDPRISPEAIINEVYSADGAFVTGTLGGVVYVSEVDGRVIDDGQMGPKARRLRALDADLLDER